MRCRWLTRPSLTAAERSKVATPNRSAAIAKDGIARLAKAVTGLEVGKRITDPAAHTTYGSGGSQDSQRIPRLFHRPPRDPYAIVGLEHFPDIAPGNPAVQQVSIQPQQSLDLSRRELLQ